MLVPRRRRMEDNACTKEEDGVTSNNECIYSSVTCVVRIINIKMRGILPADIILLSDKE